MKLNAKSYQQNIYFNFVSKTLGMKGYYEIVFREQIKKDRRFLKKIIRRYTSRYYTKNVNIIFTNEYKHMISYKNFYH